MKKDSTTRQSNLDTVAGLFIIYMIYMHCCQWTETTDMQFNHVLSSVFVSFMAWFFFKSGMFHNFQHTVKSSAISSFKKLFKPYISFFIIGYFVLISFNLWEGDTDWHHYSLSIIKQSLCDGGTHKGALHLWFLVTLFLVKSLSPAILNKFNNLGVIFMGLTGCIFALIGKHLGGSLHPYYVFNFFPAMFFYILGNKLKEKQYCTVLFLLASLFYIVSLLSPSLVDFRSNSIIYGHYSTWLVFATSGIIVFDNITRRVLPNIPIITTIGNESIFWFVSHWFVLMVSAKSLRIFFPELTGMLLLLYVFATVMILLFIFRYLAYKTRLHMLLGL